jgi:conjugative relaxase-like TrwC/TraI family protein
VLSVKTLSPSNTDDLEAQVEYLFEGRESEYWAKSAVHTEYWGALSKRWGRWGGRVGRADFELLMQGVHPEWGLRVKAGPRGKHRAGLDLCFSAPKSLSLLVALGREELRQAHRQAVRDALDYIERHYVRYRLVRNGRVTYQKSCEALFAIFEHEVSRAKQPQLHSHSILFNFTLCPDGQYRAISDEEIYRALMSAGAVYRTSLARYIQECGYGINLTDPDKFLFEIAGVPDEVLEALSARRRQIEALVARWRRENRYPDADERKLYELACLKSRPNKDEDIRLRDTLVQAEVDRALGAVGLTRDALLAQVDALGDVLPAGESDPRAAVRRAVRLLGERATFMPLHAVIRQALALGAGRLDVYRVEKALGDLIVSGEVQAWPVEGYATVLITTSELIEAEKEFLRRIEAGKNSVRPLVEASRLVVPDGLSRDQAEAYRFILTSPHRVMGVVGLAGAGKSRLIEALVRTLESHGYRVAVVAPTGKAADELVRLGLTACTVDAYLAELSGHAGSDSHGGAPPPPPLWHMMS